MEAQVKDAKTVADEGSHHGTQNETLQRRLQLLEEEAEEADKNLRETNDKYVPSNPWLQQHIYMIKNLQAFRLRQTDVKAGHFERKVQALELDRDQWEQKFEEMSKKYSAVQKELEDFQHEIGNI